MCVCVYVHVWHGTDAEDIEAEALADGLVDELIWEAIKAHVARQGQGPDSLMLRNTSHRKTDHSPDAADIFTLNCKTFFKDDPKQQK